MPNSELQEKSWPISDVLRSELTSKLAPYQGKENAPGVKRAKGILGIGSIGYAQIKKIKTEIDAYKAKPNPTQEEKREYDLIGGDIMRNWIENTTLGNSRKAIKQEKTTRMMAGEENQFIAPHDKDKENADPTGIRIPKVKSKSKYIMLDRSVTEEIQRIKQMIDYMNK